MRNNVNITSGCMVDAGVVVAKDISEAGACVGVEAKKIR